MIKNSVLSEDRFLERWNSPNRNIIIDSLPKSIFDYFLSFLNGKDVSALSRANCRLLKICNFEKGSFPWLSGITSRVMAIYVHTVLKKTLFQANDYTELRTIEGLHHVHIFPSSLITSFNFFTNITNFTPTIDCMPRLQTLSVHGIFSDHLEDEFKTLNDKSLSLLKKLPELRNLDFTGNFYSVTSVGWASLKDITSLENLNLAYCTITPTDLSQLNRSTSLRSLNLHRCSLLTDAWLDELSLLTSLNKFIVTDCDQITGVGISNLVSLTHLDLAGRQFNAVSLSGLSNLVNLMELNLQVFDIINLEGLTSLTSLSLHAPIHPTMLLPLNHSPSLTILSFSSCFTLTDERLQDLCGFQSLQQLHISDCYQITDNGLALLSSLTTLTTLTVEHCNRITPEYPSQLIKLIKAARSLKQEESMSPVRSLGNQMIHQASQLKVVFKIAENLMNVFLKGF